MPFAKKKKECEEGAPFWLLSWGDLTTLMLTFFVMMYDVGSIDKVDLNITLSAFQGLGMRTGGNTLQAGKLAELGNTIMALPSMEKGQALARARKAAVSAFQPEIRARMVRVREDERGLVISLASDAYFRPGTAEINIEQTRALLQRIAALLSSDAWREGSSGSRGTPTTRPWPPAGRTRPTGSSPRRGRPRSCTTWWTSA